MMVAMAGSARPHRAGGPPLERTPSCGACRLALALIIVSLAGVVIGLRVDGHVTQDVGPFTATFASRPSLTGGTDVQIPPLGSLQRREPRRPGPPEPAARLARPEPGPPGSSRSPNGVQVASDSAVPDVEDGVTRLVLQSAGVAVLGAMLLGALVFRRMSRVAICGGIALADRSRPAARSRFARSGRARSRSRSTRACCATRRPSIGDARSIANRFSAYRDELQSLVDNVSRLYGTVSSLPVYAPIARHDPRAAHLRPAPQPVGLVGHPHRRDRSSTSTSSSTPATSTTGVRRWSRRSSTRSAGSRCRTSTSAATTTRRPRRRRSPSSRTRSCWRTRSRTVDGLTIAGIGDPRFTPDKASDESDPGLGRDRLRADARGHDQGARQDAGRHRARARPGVGRRAGRHGAAGPRRPPAQPRDLRDAAGAGRAADAR